MPDRIKECIDSQKIPGYEHVLITNDNYYHCRYVDECVEAGLYGKATDYLRMHYLYEMGGIYLDADTTVLKPFDEVLHNKVFACEERNQFVANGIVGAIKGHPMLKHYLKLIEENFIGSGELVFQQGMYLWTELTKYSQWSRDVKLYEPEWFLPYDHQSGKTEITDKTITNHFYLKSWLQKP